MKTTIEHPFYVEGKGWIETAHLMAGDVIETRNGAGARVLSARATGESAPTFNLTVETSHTFLAGKTELVVHNSACDLGNAADAVRALSKAGTDKAGNQIGRIVVDSKGNAMIEPVGGRTVAAGRGGVDTHTLYPNGSNYQRLYPQGHANNPTPHGHGHAPGTWPGIRGQGPSLDVHGNVVPSNSPSAHWPIN